MRTQRLVTFALTVALTLTLVASSAPAQAPAKNGLVFGATAQGVSYPTYVRPKTPPAAPADIIASGTLDKATYPGSPSASPPTYPQIAYDTGATVTMTVVRLDGSGAPVTGTQSTFAGTIKNDQLTWECSTSATSIRPAGTPYAGFLPGTYQVTITVSKVKITKAPPKDGAAPQVEVRDAVLVGTVVIPVT